MMAGGLIATLVLPDGARAEVAPASPEGFTLEELQTHVGGHIELVPGCDVQILVDEDGRLKRLKPNPLASHIAGQLLVGPALIAGRLVDFDDVH